MNYIYTPPTKRELVEIIRDWYPDEPVRKFREMPKKRLYAIYYNRRRGSKNKFR